MSWVARSTLGLEERVIGALALFLRQGNRLSFVTSSPGVKRCEEDCGYRAGCGSDRGVREKHACDASDGIRVSVDECDVGDGYVGSGSEERECGGGEGIIGPNGFEHESDLDGKCDCLK